MVTPVWVSASGVTALHVLFLSLHLRLYTFVSIVSDWVSLQRRVRVGRFATVCLFEYRFSENVELMIVLISVIMFCLITVRNWIVQSACIKHNRGAPLKNSRSLREVRIVRWHQWCVPKDITSTPELWYHSQVKRGFEAATHKSGSREECEKWSRVGDSFA